MCYGRTKLRWDKSGEAIASCVKDVRYDQIIPHALDESVAIAVAKAVKNLC